MMFTPPLSRRFLLRTTAMNTPRLALSLLLLCLGGLSIAQDFIPRCGDCWCITETNEDCPDYGEGIYDDFSDTMIETFDSFTLISDPILLQTEDGNANCYPFAEAVGPIDGYPESNNPQCERPVDNSGESVCTIQYTTAADSAESCLGRRYALFTYPSQEEADSLGAITTHRGPCGVCSNLGDLAMRMKFSDSFESNTVACSASYVINKDFERLVGCFENTDNFGLSRQCAQLWAHYVATNANLCAAQCFDTSELNGPPPECELLDCLQCSNSTFQGDFDTISGRTLTNSGITQRIARACSDFVRVNHDPCQGNTTFDEPDTMAPQPTQAPTSGSTSPTGVWVALTAAAIVIGFGRV
jgi:hypothetical protein